jgi:hypothetical protein
VQRKDQAKGNHVRGRAKEVKSNSNKRMFEEMKWELFQFHFRTALTPTAGGFTSLAPTNLTPKIHSPLHMSPW